MCKGSVLLANTYHVFQYPTLFSKLNPLCCGVAYTSKAKVSPLASLTRSHNIGRRLVSGNSLAQRPFRNRDVITDITEPAGAFVRQVHSHPDNRITRVYRPQYHLPLLLSSTDRSNVYPIEPIMTILDEKTMLGNFITSALIPRINFEVVDRGETTLLGDPGIKHSAIEFLRSFGVHGVVKYEGDYALDSIRDVLGAPKGDDLLSLWRASKFMLDLNDGDYIKFLKLGDANLHDFFDTKLSAASRGYSKPSNTLRDAMIETYDSGEFF